VVIAGAWSFAPRLSLTVALPAVALALVLHHPLLTRDRLALWTACWKPGESDRIKDVFALNRNGGQTNWLDLRGAIKVLQDRGAGDREVTCWNWTTIAAYTELGLEPSNRFVYPGERLGYFPSFNKVIWDETMHSQQRYVVFDLLFIKGPSFDYYRQVEFPQSMFEPFKALTITHVGRYVVIELRPPDGTDDKPG
jgi:hypothetical protein